jgi:hypothetical protein
MRKEGVVTEKEFRNYLELRLRTARMPMVAGYVDSCDPVIHNAGKYMGGHEVLFEGHQTVSIPLIIRMGQLLLRHDTSLETKEMLCVILAHHPSREALNALQLYCMNPDKELHYFARMALDECEMWNE